MGYLPLILILGIVGGCALGAYELFEAIERDEDQDPRSGAERPRAGAGSGEADAGWLDGWLDGRIRGLEERLDRLELACLRVEALASGSKRS